MKYLIKYTAPKTNEVEYFEGDSMVQLAVEHLFFNLQQREDGGWEVWLLGKNVAHYTNEWTRAEVLRDYFNDFERKNNWKNIEYYKQITYEK